MEVVIYEGVWSCETARAHPTALFLFGDNDLKKGAGGQAILRYEPNVAGIPTKKAPHNRASAFYNDAELSENRRKIDEAVHDIRRRLPRYTTLVVPQNGFGTGMARLNQRAPETFAYLKQKFLEFLEELDEDAGSKMEW